MPTTLWCIGRNYADHVKELNNAKPSAPVVFLKAGSSLRPLVGGTTAYPGASFHHECELVLRVGADVPLGATVGWTCVDAVAVGLDLTRRDLQSELKKKGLPWGIAKAFAGAAPVSPFVPINAVSNPQQLRFGLDVNGEPRQSGCIADVTFDVPTLLTYIAGFGGLQKGDLVFTGTPAGVGPLTHGDHFRVWLSDPERSWEGVL